MVITKTVLGVSDAPLPVPKKNATLDAARSMAPPERPHGRLLHTRQKPPALHPARIAPRLRGAGGPVRCPLARRDREDRALVTAENRLVRTLARRIRESCEETEALDALIAEVLEDDPAYVRPAPRARIGPRTASELVISIDIDDFPDHDHLASYCGIAPKVRRSGTSASSASASRKGTRG